MSRTLIERADALLACAASEIAVDGRPVPGRQFLAPGAEVAWDDCCDGQLWVRVLRAHPVNPFPAKVMVSVPCPYPLGFQIGLGILRCSTGLSELDQQDGAPSAADLDHDGREMVYDMAALWRAIQCCGTDEERRDELSVTDMWSPLGPTGGCYGGEWLLWIDARLEGPPEP